MAVRAQQAGEVEGRSVEVARQWQLRLSLGEPPGRRV